MVSLSEFNEHFLWIDSLRCFVHLLKVFDHQFRQDVSICFKAIGMTAAGDNGTINST